MVIDLEQPNELVKPGSSRIRKFLSFVVAFFYAGLLINAIRGFGTLVFFIVIGVFPEFLNLLTVQGTELFSGLFNVLTVVVAFIFSRRVYRRFTHTLSEEEKQKMSVWKSGATGLFIIIGLILFYAIPALITSIDA
jgi:hypothetical protein